MIENLNQYKYKFNFIIRMASPLKIIINKSLKRLNLFLIWRTGNAIGDQLLIAGFAKCIKRKNKCSIIAITKYPELLSLSPWINNVLSPKNIPFWYFVYYLLKLIEGERIIEYNFPYKKFGYNSQLEAYQSGLYKDLNQPPIWHAHVADRFNSELFDKFIGGLTKSGKTNATRIIKVIRYQYPNVKIGIINPIGKETFTKAKIYGFKNYQKIIDLTKNKILWLQVGKENDKLLKNIHKDVRGKSLEFLVDIISLSDLVLSDEGVLNHFAGSFPKVNSYVTYSEFSPTTYYSYSNTRTLGIPLRKSKENYWSYDLDINYRAPNPIKLSKSLLNFEFNKS